MKRRRFLAVVFGVPLIPILPDMPPMPMITVRDLLTPRLDSIRLMLLQAEMADFHGCRIVCYPTDWTAIKLKKTRDWMLRTKWVFAQDSPGLIRMWT